MVFCAGGLAPKNPHSLFVWYVISVVKRKLWSSRCSALFERRHLDGEAVLRICKASIRDRLEADLLRLGPQAFSAIWVVGGGLFRISNSRVTFLLL